MWWGGNDGWAHEQHWDQENNSEVYQVQGYSGKGPRMEYGAKGKGNLKGDKGGGKKGSGKGYGKNKGKGKGGGFQGYCHWCGDWGHSQGRCWQKDEYMDGVRKVKGVEKGSRRSADNGRCRTSMRPC